MADEEDGLEDEEVCDECGNPEDECTCEICGGCGEKKHNCSCDEE